MNGVTKEAAKAQNCRGLTCKYVAELIISFYIRTYEYVACGAHLILRIDDEHDDTLPCVLLLLVCCCCSYFVVHALRILWLYCCNLFIMYLWVGRVVCGRMRAFVCCLCVRLLLHSNVNKWTDNVFWFFVCNAWVFRLFANLLFVLFAWSFFGII